MSGSINWKNHLVDFFFVTLGVLLAFGLNSWNEKRQERQKVDLFLKGIMEELVDNQKELEEAVSYHAELLSNLRKDPKTVNLILNPPDVSNVAWKLAESDIFKMHVDPKTFRILSKVYQTHDGLQSYNDDLLKNINQINVLSPYYKLAGQPRTVAEEEALETELSQGWVPIFESWVGIEKGYLYLIGKALEEM